MDEKGGEEKINSPESGVRNTFTNSEMEIKKGVEEVSFKSIYQGC